MKVSDLHLILNGHRIFLNTEILDSCLNSQQENPIDVLIYRRGMS
jgi:hypothetical protein